MKHHIGHIIEKVVNDKGIKITELSRRIGKSSQAMYGIFKRESITTDLLESFSEVLEHDFFQYYTKPLPTSSNVVNEAGEQYQAIKKNTPTISITINNIEEKNISRIFRQLKEFI